MLSGKLNVKWSQEIEKVAFFHPSEPAEDLNFLNILTIPDKPILTGSMTSSLPSWRLVENLKSESEIKFISVDVVFQTLFMMISVPNYSYEKQVSLVYTFDDWKTVLTAEGGYFASPDLKNDLFQISIPLDNLTPLNHSLKFCVKYTHGSLYTIYENNFGQNHQLSLYTSPKFLTPTAKRRQKRERKRLVSLTMATGLGPISKYWPLSHIPPPKNMLNSYEMHCLSYTY